MMSDDLKDWYSKMNSSGDSADEYVDPMTLQRVRRTPEETNDDKNSLPQTDNAFLIASYIDRGLPFFNEYFRLLFEDLLSKSQAGFPRELYARNISSNGETPSISPEEQNRKALADNKQAFIKFVKLLNSLASEIDKGSSDGQ